MRPNFSRPRNITDVRAFNFRKNLDLKRQSTVDWEMTETIKILQKDPIRRSDSDLDFAATQIRDLGYFKELILDPDERWSFARECAKYLKHEYYSQGSEVIRQGDAGNEFYMILEGRVGVYIPKPKDEMYGLPMNINKAKRQAFDQYTKFLNQHLKSNKKRINSAQRKKPKKNTILGVNLDSLGQYRRYSTSQLQERSRTEPNTPESDKSNPQQKEMQNDKIRKLILTEKNGLLEGEDPLDLTFDEKVLLLNNKKGLNYYYERGLCSFKRLNHINKGGYFGEIALIFHTKRTATIIATNDCHMLSLSSDDYKNIFASQVQNVIKKVKFVEKVFPNSPKKNIMKFCYMLKEKQFQYNEPLYREGDNPECMFIVKDGELSKIIEAKQEASHQNMRVRKGLYRRKLIVGNLIGGNFCGEEELINPKPRQYTATASTETFVYQISKRDFIHVICNQFQYYLEYMKSRMQGKDKWRQVAMKNQEKVRLSDISPLVHKQQQQKTYIEETWASGAKVTTPSHFPSRLKIPSPRKPPPPTAAETTKKTFKEKYVAGAQAESMVKVSKTLQKQVQIHIREDQKHLRPGQEEIPEDKFDLKKQNIYNRQIKFTAKGVEKVKTNSKIRQKYDLIKEGNKIVDSLSPPKRQSKSSFQGQEPDQEEMKNFSNTINRVLQSNVQLLKSNSNESKDSHPQSGFLDIAINRQVPKLQIDKIYSEEFNTLPNHASTNHTHSSPMYQTAFPISPVKMQKTFYTHNISQPSPNNQDSNLLHIYSVRSVNDIPDNHNNNNNNQKDYVLSTPKKNNLEIEIGERNNRRTFTHFSGGFSEHLKNQQSLKSFLQQSFKQQKRHSAADISPSQLNKMKLLQSSREAYMQPHQPSSPQKRVKTGHVLLKGISETNNVKESILNTIFKDGSQSGRAARNQSTPDLKLGLQKTNSQKDYLAYRKSSQKLKPIKPEKIVNIHN